MSPEPSQLLTDERASYLKHLVVQSILQAHDSKIKPESFFEIVINAVRVLSVVECAVAMANIRTMLRDGASPEKLVDGITKAISVASEDCGKIFNELDEKMTLVEQTRAPRTVN